MQQYVLSKILDNYDTATVPYNEGQTTPVFRNSVEPSCPTGEPVVVDVQYALDTLRVEPLRSHTIIHFNGRLNLGWDDSRLSYAGQVPAWLVCPSIKLSSSELVWRPDVFFANAATSKDIYVQDDDGDRREQALSIFTNGRVQWSRRARVQILCEFDYTRLPCEPRPLPAPFAPRAPPSLPPGMSPTPASLAVLTPMAGACLQMTRSIAASS